MRIIVAYTLSARQVRELLLELPEGATVSDALSAAGQSDTEFGAGIGNLIIADAQALAVWGQKAGATQVLRADDRVEVCRALTVDPKQAREERFKQQGRRTTGLFARQRLGAKTGY